MSNLKSSILTSNEGEENDAEKNEDDDISLQIGESKFKLTDKFLKEVVDDLDLAEGAKDVTKGEFARIGLKLIPILMTKNKDLKKENRALVVENKQTTILVSKNEELKSENISLVIENKQMKEEIDSLKEEGIKKDSMLNEKTREAFDSKTREILKNEEIQELKREQSLIKCKIPNDQYTNIMTSLRSIEKKQAQESPMVKEMSIKIEENKVNTDRLVEIMGARDRFRNTACKIQVLKELESSNISLNICGNSEVFKNLQSDLNLKKDIETLIRKDILSLSETERTGVDNLIPLINESEGKQVLVLILNFTLEMAESMLVDRNYHDCYVIQIKSYIAMIRSVSKDKFDKIIYVLPPATEKSLIIVQKVSRVIDAVLGPNESLLDMYKVQQELASEWLDEEVFEVEGTRFLMKFTMVDGESKEGWSCFSTNVMMTKLIENVVGKGKQEFCRSCGLGHSSRFNCEELARKDKNHGKEASSKDDQKQEYSEQCLNCFRNHPEMKCQVKKTTECSFDGCYRSGHLKIVHFPKKKDTVARLTEKYGDNFSINTGGIKDRKRVQSNSKSNSTEGYSKTKYSKGGGQ